MLEFRSRAEMSEEKITKNRQPFIIQNISKINFKSKYLSDKFDGVQLVPNVKTYFDFKDISDVKKTD